MANERDLDPEESGEQPTQESLEQQIKKALDEAGYFKRIGLENPSDLDCNGPRKEGTEKKPT